MLLKFFALREIPAVLLFGALLLLGGCGRDSVTTAEDSKIVMGTVARLTVRADEITAQAALRDGMAVLTQVERDADGTAIAAVESAAGTGTWSEISPELYETLTRAQEIARRSGGAFDVTAGALTELWERARTEKHPPSPEAVAEARTRVGYEALELDAVEDNGQTKYQARLMKAGMKIDRGALIKGLALDRIHRSWQDAGVSNALADLGTSSILGMGANEEGESWQIGIRNPRGEGPADVTGVLPLYDEVLSTSGDDERYFIYEGRRYHHIIDPRTGYPSDMGIASATVILPIEQNDPLWQGHAGLLSDMLSTAFFILGPEERRKLIVAFPETFVILLGSDGKIVGE